MEGKITVAEMSREQLIEKLTLLQGKLKEVIARKNALVSAVTIEKLHSKGLEEENLRLLQENNRMKGFLGEQFIEIPMVILEKNGKEERILDESEQSYEFLDLNNNEVEAGKAGKSKSSPRLMDSCSSHIINKETFLLHRKAEYDQKIKLNAITDFLKDRCRVKTNTGQKEIVKGKKLVISAIGHKNIGKTFALNKLCGFEGEGGVFFREKCKNQGLIVKFQQDLVVLDVVYSRGLGEEGELFGERALAKSFVEEFVWENSDVIMIVVGEMDYEEEMLIEKVKRVYGNENRILCIIHNLVHLEEKENVEKRIEFLLKKSEIKTSIHHVFLAKEYSPAGEHYNKKAVNQMRKLFDMNFDSKTFNLIENFKNFFSKNAIKYHFPSETRLEEHFVSKEKSYLKCKNDNNDEILLPKSPKFNLIGIIANPLFDPNYSLKSLGKNAFRLTVELPGVANCKASLISKKGVEILSISFTKKGLKDEIVTEIELGLDSGLIPHRKEIKKQRIENGVLEMELELF